MNRRLLGDAAEARAAETLAARGYRVLERNFSCRHGEIDFIAEKDGILCFIEVRSRSSTAFGLPQESVRSQKRRHIALAAKIFLSRWKGEIPPCRFDVVGLYPSPGGEVIEIVEDAFETPR